MLKGLDYRIIGSGSTGNAVRIENIMVDCGVPFSHMKDDLYKVDTLLITHSHSDHVKPETLSRIRKEFPRVKVYGNADVAYRWDMDVIIGTAELRLPKKRTVIPFDGVHDVPVTCFVIQMMGLNILYATDTERIQLPKPIPLDYVFLESNYDEKKLREMSKQYRHGRYDPYLSSAGRHLSTQQCREFYFVNRRNEESKLIELHKSHRFY